ncbi:MAG: hypothetical protein ACLUO8_00715 [Christensenellales bacterium]
MKPQEIDRLLATYRKNRARVEHLAIEISRMEAELGNQEKTAILHDALRAQTYGNVRKSSSAKKPVEDLVLQYLDGYKPPQLHQWREELESMKKEQQERKQAMRYVEVWIGALTGREQKVVQLKVLDGLTWSELEAMSDMAFGFHITAGGLRKIKRRAMKMIYEIAG